MNATDAFGLTAAILFHLRDDGVVVPIGKLATRDTNYPLMYNEFVVFRAEQIKLRYLVTIGFSEPACEHDFEGVGRASSACESSRNVRVQNDRAVQEKMKAHDHNERFVDATPSSRQKHTMSVSTSMDSLNEIFRFKFKRPSSSQDEATCERLVQHFCEFVASIEPVQVGGFAFSVNGRLVDDRKVPLHEFANEEHDELKRTVAILSRDGNARGDIWIEKWFPAHGCALQMEMVSAANIVLNRQVEQVCRRFDDTKTTQQIKWDDVELYETSNFFSTIQLPPKELQNEFARLIDGLLWFSNGSKDMLSEYEADHVLRLLWTAKETPRFQFMNLSYAMDHVESFGSNAPLNSVP
ncbi:hypothetical protein FI667_g17598, partial [Globisporangium splendens]